MQKMSGQIENSERLLIYTQQEQTVKATALKSQDR